MESERLALFLSLFALGISVVAILVAQDANSIAKTTQALNYPEFEIVDSGQEQMIFSPFELSQRAVNGTAVDATGWGFSIQVRNRGKERIDIIRFTDRPDVRKNGEPQDGWVIVDREDVELDGIGQGGVSQKFVRAILKHGVCSSNIVNGPESCPYKQIESGEYEVIVKLECPHCNPDNRFKNISKSFCVLGENEKCGQ